MKRNSSIVNGKKGGRPKTETYKQTCFIPEFNLIILTETQYNTLIERYGFELLHRAFSIFQDWLKQSPKSTKCKGKNNYAYFRSDGWVINEAKIQAR